MLLLIFRFLYYYYVAGRSVGLSRDWLVDCLFASFVGRLVFDSLVFLFFCCFVVSLIGRTIGCFVL